MGSYFNAAATALLALAGGTCAAQRRPAHLSASCINAGLGNTLFGCSDVKKSAPHSSQLPLGIDWDRFCPFPATGGTEPELNQPVMG